MTVDRPRPNLPGSGAAVFPCLLLVVLGDVLFYRQPFGISTAVFGLVLLGTLLVQARFALFRSRWASGFVAAACPLLVVLAYRPGPVAGLLAVLCLVLAALASRSPENIQPWLWIDRLLEFTVLGWQSVFRDGEAVMRKAESTAEGSAGKVKGIVKWIPVAVLALVFVGLFALANPVIGEWVESIEKAVVQFFEKLSLPTIPRVIIWAFTGVWSWAFLRHRTTRRVVKAVVVDDSVLRAEQFFLNPQTIVGALAVFNGVFALQNILDAGYLWGGAPLPAGMTYAQYAHRGAYPLVATTLLAAALMLVIFRPTADARQTRAGRLLVYTWIAQNVFLTFSAAWRLNLYVQTYHLTRLRLAAVIWMLLVAAGLIWICVRIVARKSNEWLVNVNLVSLVAVLYLCAFINFPGIIAWYNCRHSYQIAGEGATLDVAYLETLGPEALPALQWFAAEAADQEDLVQATEERIGWLSHELAHSLRSWQGWTWRRHQLAQTVKPTTGPPVRGHSGDTP